MSRALLEFAMYDNLNEFLQDLLGDDHSVGRLVELLERDGFLSSPLVVGLQRPTGPRCIDRHDGQAG